MRLPSTLLAASALALLASDSALAAVAGASEGTKVSTMAFPDLDVLAVSHSAKRSLHDNERVDEDDEERWAGAKLFSAAKLEQAMNDSKYAETLMMRWKRHGFDIEDTKLSLEASKLSKDPRLNTVYRNYAAWLDKHFSRVGLKPTTCSTRRRSKTRWETATTRRRCSGSGRPTITNRLIYSRS
uniref:RxLR effector protein n=1 Tax=Phytophthora sojae TaxID=67593 RepID=G1FQW7_PHYSO|nr:Avh24.1 [Phytophthora sojae]